MHTPPQTTPPIAVFGEMLVDQFDTGPVVGGAPFNVARHLAAFGHAPLMLSAVGTDANATLVLAELARFGLRAEGVQATPDYPTGVVDVQMDAGGGHTFRIRTGCAWGHIGLAPSRRAMAATPRLADAGWLYAGTLSLCDPVSRATQLALLQDHRGPTFLDLNWRAGHVDPQMALQAIAQADVLKVNDEELLMLGQWLGAAPLVAAAGTQNGAAKAVVDRVPEALAQTARWVVERLSLQTLLVTLGPAGAMALGRQGLVYARPVRPVRLVDTVGAGDAFAAVTLAGLLRGWDMALTLQRATDFAGHICETRGAVPAERKVYSVWTGGWQSP